MISKRMSLKLVAVVAVALLFMQGLTSCNSAPKKADEKSAEVKKEQFIGLQLYSVRDDMGKDVAGTLKAVGESGYKFVETAGYGDGLMYGIDPVEFKNLCESNGLQFLGAHTGQAVPTEETWDETMAWWDTCIAAHKAAGVKWIVQPWMGGSAYESLEGLKDYCEYFNAVGEKCNAAGIRFGYHNHDQEFTTEYEGKPLYDWMLELTDPEKVMFQLDLYWIAEGGKNALDYFEKYPGRFELWHIKDEKELGESGKMDFASVFAEREKSGAKYGIVEVERYNFEPIESCRKSMDYLKSQDYVDFYE
ncbi:Sugar phosphate isomerase/epimerase [Draconibacterium orientale]|uniref:Sugar phosphate isomerase n=2 Tax=Draconibacterium orientale TaxID=1168034 RepID=X5DH32_9BACT|nr:sugar phosphate isomerase [Draconibacterium orientale]SET16087.1 Sugar phosphate isomerase/epimerase [Draconibacterium orientale]